MEEKISDQQSNLIVSIVFEAHATVGDFGQFEGACCNPGFS